MDAGRQEFAERRFGHAWTPSRFDVTRAARLRQLLARRPRGLLLDVGCYDGQFITSVLGPRPTPGGPPRTLGGRVPRTSLFEEARPEAELPDQERIVGLDVSQAALRLAASRGLRPVRGQVEASLPFRSDAFATVVAAEVIEHVFDTQGLLDEIARVLEPNGWLALTTPNLVALSGRAQLVLGRSPHNVEFDASPGTSGHIRYLTFDTLERLLRRAGLRPLGRWTNVVHFSVLGSSELVGRWRPTLGHTLISLAVKPSAVSRQPSARFGPHRSAGTASSDTGRSIESTEGSQPRAADG